MGLSNQALTHWCLAWLAISLTLCCKRLKPSLKCHIVKLNLVGRQTRQSAEISHMEIAISELHNTEHSSNQSISLLRFAFS